MKLLPFVLLLASCGREPTPRASFANPPKLPAAPRIAFGRTLPAREVVFIGNSFTYSQFAPVSAYNSPAVVDENPETSRRSRRGGIPGLVARFAEEQRIPMRVHMYATGLAYLSHMETPAKKILARRAWDAVVLQDHSKEPFETSAAAGCPRGPGAELICTSGRLARVAHARNRGARVFLAQTPVPPDAAAALGESEERLVRRSDRVFVSAARRGGEIAGVAFVGEAFLDARRLGVAAPDDPSRKSRFERFLLAGGVAFSNAYRRYVERHAAPPRAALDEAGPLFDGRGRMRLFASDRHHCSTAGSYLTALVEYAELTRADPRTLGSRERAARDLGIPPEAARDLQIVAARAAIADGARLIRPASSEKSERP